MILILIIASSIYKNQNKSLLSLKGKIEAETKKNELLNNISQTEKMIKAYKNLLNKKDISLSITIISNIAKDCKINIVFIKPAAVENYPVYIRYPFDLVINAGNYHILGKFINKLESHPDVFFVDKINIRPVDKSKESAKGYNVTADLTLSTIVFRDKD